MAMYVGNKRVAPTLTVGTNDSYTKEEINALLEAQQAAFKDELYYKSGDTYKVEVGTYMDTRSYPGCVTSGAQQVRFTVTTPKRLDNITSISCNRLLTCFRTVEGGYTPAQSWDAVQNANKIECVKAGENLVIVNITYSDWGLTNNTPVSTSIREMTLTFT